MPISRIFLAMAAAASALILGVSVNAGPAKNYHLFRATSFDSLRTQLPPPASDMNYYGGSVFSNVKVVTVMWNKDVLQSTQDQIPLFTAALADSTYVDKATEFNTKGVAAINGHKSTNQTIHRGTYLGQVMLTPKHRRKVLRDEDIQNELKYQIAQGALPPSDYNTLYMIYFPADITIEIDGQASCVIFGAYHFATNDKRRAKKSNIFYSVEPECNSGFGFLTFAASHEFVEALSDNVPTPGVNPDYPQAWNDSTGFETADKCSTSGTLNGTAGSWEVTQYYLNSLHGCSTGNYSSP